ncbi:adhesin [Bordetella pertussis]|nr:adhesin [Bordetella pertussis]
MTAVPGAAISRTWVEVSNPWRAQPFSERISSERIRRVANAAKVPFDVARQARSGLSGILRNGIALTICPSSE